MCMFVCYRWFKHITEAAESYKGKEKPAHRRSVRKAGSSGSVNEEAVAGEPGETGEAPPDEQGTPGEDDEIDRQRKDSKEEYVSASVQIVLYRDCMVGKRGSSCQAGFAP